MFPDPRAAADWPPVPVFIMEEEKHFLNKEQLAELRQAFRECDRNNDNFITTGELGWTMRVMGFNPTEAELQQLVNKESGTLTVFMVVAGLVSISHLMYKSNNLSTTQTALGKSSLLREGGKVGNISEGRAPGTQPVCSVFF